MQDANELLQPPTSPLLAVFSPVLLVSRCTPTACRTAVRPMLLFCCQCVPRQVLRLMCMLGNFLLGGSVRQVNTKPCKALS